METGTDRKRSCTLSLGDHGRSADLSTLSSISLYLGLLVDGKRKKMRWKCDGEDA